MKPGRLSGCCAALLLLVSADASAQCRVEGVARAADGKALGGAIVRIEIPDQKAPITTTAGEDGRYVFENVKPGIWVRIIALQNGRLVSEAFTLVTQRVEPVDLVARPTSTRVTGDWDLDPSGGAAGGLVGVIRTTSGAVVPAARIAISETTIAATSDSAGRYGFGGLRSGAAVELEATAPGYDPATLQVIVPDEGRQEVNFTLKPIHLRGEARPDLAALSLADDNSQVTATPEQVSGIPSLGRKDVFRAVQFLPGVVGTSEAAGELFVRGGTPGENLISFDGFTLYPVQREFNPFSLLNPDAIGSVDFARSAVDAGDGGRLSAIARVTGRSLIGSRPSGSVDFSLLGTRAVVAVPLGPKASFLFAARRSFPGTLNDKILDTLDGTGGQSARAQAPRFSGGTLPFDLTSSFRDLNGKLQVDVTDRDRFAATFYDASEDANNSRDLAVTRNTSISTPLAFELPSDTQTQVSDLQSWAARGMSASWTHHWSTSASTLVSVGHSTSSDNGARASLLTSPSTGVDYSFLDGRGGSNALTGSNDVADTTIRLYNAVTLGFAHALSFGGERSTIDTTYAFQSEAMKASDATTTSALVTVLSRQSSGQLMTGFVQDSWRPLTKLTIVPGLRVTHYDLASATYLEPRVGLNFQIAPSFHFKGGWSVDHQAVNRVVYEDRLLGDREFWALSDGSSIPVPWAQQLSAGLSVDLPGAVLDFQGYYRDLRDLTMVAPRLFAGTAPDASTQLLHYGTGRAYGFEAVVQKEWTRHTLWTAYTGGKAEYTYPTLQAGAFPASQDQTHEFKVADSVQVRGRWWASGSWVLATGRPYTAAEGTGEVWFPSGLTLTQVIFGTKNSSRLPAYHRLDLSTEREFRFGGFKSTVGVTVFNVYDRDNVRVRVYESTGSTANDLTYMGRVVNGFVRFGF